MTVQIEEFLGTVVSIPETGLYDPEEGLWLKRQPDGRIAMGMTQPARCLWRGPYGILSGLLNKGRGSNRVRQCFSG